MRLEEIERQGLFLQRMDDTGEWFCYHPLFGNFLRQRCQWELAAELRYLGTSQQELMELLKEGKESSHD